MKIAHHTCLSGRRPGIGRGNRWRHVALWLALLCGWNGVYAQTYPVYVTPSLMPPYSLKLSDYSAVGSQQLVVTIMVNDIHISNLPVKLHIKIEGSAGVTIETLPTLTTLPVYLNGGQATLLFGADLTDYFNLDNLVFTGYSKEQYRRTGYLPEGFYKFTVEILHYGTNRLISNRGVATAWMALGKPPVLRLPDDNAELGQIAGMPLTFSWLPSNVGIPTAGVHYTFELWELRIPGINPNVIAASMPAFHSVQQAHTTLVVQPAELFLEQGLRYAWRVTAFDPLGRVPFEQEGHSAVRTFTYQTRCDSVTNFTVERQAARGTFRWDAGTNHTSFNVELRNPATAYFRQSQTFDNKVTYPSLDFGTTYQLRVQAVCNGDPQHVSAYSAWRTLSIPELQKDTTSCPDCRCGESPPPPPITNFTLRRDLQSGDIISNAAGSTRFILKTVVPQADGVYKGLFWFWAEIWNLKILCEYWDLSVNTDNVIVKVDYESVYNPQFLLDADAAKEFVDNLADAIAEVTTNTNIRDTVKLDVPIKGIYTDGDGRLVVVTEHPDGSLTETPLQAGGEFNRTLIQGVDGEEYVVTADGQVMGVEEFEQTGGNARLMDNYKEEKEASQTAAYPSVTFSASPDQQYGFDVYTEIKTNIQGEYPELKPGYRPAFKSVASYAADKVQASVANEGITFKNEMGLPPLSSGHELTVRGGAGGSDVALYAYQRTDSTEEIVGKLNILSFDEQVKKLYIVSVNGATLPDAGVLKAELNKIYAQAVVKWEVVEGRKISVAFPDGRLTHGGSGSWKVYNADQKSVLEAYGEVEKEALCLFFVDGVQGKEGVKGYMPLQYQYGFIYDNPDATLIAHELAHGAFVLWHTFSSEQFIAPQGATSNLMDYNNGAELWKHQWQLISDPQRLWFKSWQDEEEGEMVSGPYAEKNILDFLNAIRKINYSDTIKIYDKSISCPDGCVASNLKLGEKILSEIRLTTNTASPITDEYVFIKASEQFIKSCEECIDDSYAKLVFTDHHSEKYPVSTGLERVSIIVKRVELPVLQNYLYTEKQIEQEIMVENISWVSQKDESLFGKCTGCWTSSCCRRAAEYMMGNTSMANCADSAIAVSAPYMTTSGNITTAYFNDNISAYTLATYNSAALNYNAAKTNEAVEYVKSRLKSNRPVLIGVHYVNKKLDPPNNINRATRHFMVIIGYVKEKNGTEYFLFYDPGRLMDDQADATSPNNKFIINLQQGSIQGNYDDKIYTITEIIKTN